LYGAPLQRTSVAMAASIVITFVLHGAAVIATVVLGDPGWARVPQPRRAIDAVPDARPSTSTAAMPQTLRGARMETAQPNPSLLAWMSTGGGLLWPWWATYVSSVALMCVQVGDGCRDVCSIVGLAMATLSLLAAARSAVALRCGDVSLQTHRRGGVLLVAVSTASAAAFLFACNGAATSLSAAAGLAAVLCGGGALLHAVIFWRLVVHGVLSKAHEGWRQPSDRALAGAAARLLPDSDESHDRSVGRDEVDEVGDVGLVTFVTTAETPQSVPPPVAASSGAGAGGASVPADGRSRAAESSGRLRRHAQPMEAWVDVRDGVEPEREVRGDAAAASVLRVHLQLPATAQAAVADSSHGPPLRLVRRDVCVDAGVARSSAASSGEGTW